MPPAGLRAMEEEAPVAFFDEEHREFEFTFGSHVVRCLGWEHGGCAGAWGDLLALYLTRAPARGTVLELGGVGLADGYLQS